MEAVAFFSNTNMLPGLHVTLLSMLRALKEEAGAGLTIYIYLDEVPEKEHRLLHETHQECARGTRLETIAYSPKTPTGGDLLLGNATAYGRLDLPNLLPEVSRCVYLDCDLVVNRCVSDFDAVFDGKNILFADGTGLRRNSLDRKLFEKAGLEMEGPCFNSGVMGMDLDRWRETGVDEKIVKVATEYQGMFGSADQALLNATLHDEFLPIGAGFNTQLFPTTEVPEEMEERIYHFVGSPKPWDFLGRWTSNHFKMWRQIYDETAISDKWQVRYSSFHRMIHVSKSSAQSVVQRVRG